jgi:hypothetical protein
VDYCCAEEARPLANPVTTGSMASAEPLQLPHLVHLVGRLPGGQLDPEYTIGGERYWQHQLREGLDWAEVGDQRRCARCATALAW